MTAFVRWLRISVATGLLALAYKLTPDKTILDNIVNKRNPSFGG